MKRRIISLILLLSFILLLCSCSDSESSSYFRVTFIDVGQGDSALIECDGYNMLIDAGIKGAGDTVVETLKDRTTPITHIDILVASHLHDDHVGGMGKVLDYLSLHKGGQKINLILSNSNRGKSDEAKSFVSQVERMGNKITIPSTADKPYKLGSAEVRVLFNRNQEDNDSLVLLVTYQDTSFLFTGDIQKDAHKIVADELRDLSSILEGKSNLIKMPHHGAYNSDPFLPDNASDNSLATLVNAAQSNYFVISVGKNNRYNHPDNKTIEIISQALGNDLDQSKHFFRTDECGNVIVEVAPNGRDLNITTSKH